MESVTKAVPVVCAIIRREGRVLIAKRPAGKRLGGLWEFPGGKVEPGEQPETALLREIQEELGCKVVIEEAFPSFSHAYAWGEIDLLPFLCALAPDSAEPHPHEHEAVRWVFLAEISEHEIAPADVPVLRWLKERSG